MPPRMFLCPSCESHVKADETECPHCGVAFESVPKKSRTAAMVLLGLAAVAAPAACDSEVETTDDSGTPSQTASTSMMQSTTQDSVVTAYGVGGFSNTGGFGGDAGGAGGDGGDGGEAGGAGGAGGN